MASLFSDGMVLQGNQPVPVWGWAEPGQIVEVLFDQQTHRSQAGGDGRWSVSLEPLTASTTGRDLVVAVDSDPAQGRVIRDVVVGEVWVSVGQSNMMMSIDAAEGGKAFYDETIDRVRRRLRVVHEMTPDATISDEPKQTTAAKWRAPSPSYSAVSYWFAVDLLDHFGDDVPVGMITYLAIVPAEAWVDPQTLAADPMLAPLLDHPLKVAGKSYNAVVAPTAPYALRGVLYYQGEYNAGRGLQLRTLMPALIASWRNAWDRPDLPFLFVQLPGFIEHRAEASGMDMDAATLRRTNRLKDSGTWTDVREAQLLTAQSVPKTGMAITIDTGDPYDIHPRDKRPVAHRLFLLARQVAYGEDLVANGPMPGEIAWTGDTVTVAFNHAGGGLESSDGELRGFEVAGNTTGFVPAAASIEGERVLVRSPLVERPTRLRYAWGGFPDATLCNAEGLPASPFRATDWAQTTQPDHATLPFPNGGFEQSNEDGSLAAWKVGPDIDVVDDAACEGSRSVVLRTKDKSVLHIDGIAAKAGYGWNCDPLTQASLRPGHVVAMDLNIAAMPPAAHQKLYLHLAINSSAAGFDYWDGTRTVSTTSTDFVPRTIVHRLQPKVPGIVQHFPDQIGGRFIYTGGDAEAGIRLDGLSSLTVIRPTLETDLPEVIDLGTVAGNAAPTSDTFHLTNSQAQFARQVLKDDDAGTDVPTVLYGLASLHRDGYGQAQRVLGETDHIGAILIGPDAALFRFSAAQATQDGRSLKLFGKDGTAGLSGGEKPESEPFAIEFLGAAEAREYRATLRIITQAGNQGVLSQGLPGEPPANLFYVDTAVRVAVGSSAPD